MPGATIADEADKMLAFLEAIVNTDDTTTVGEIRLFIGNLDAVRFNRNKINGQLGKLDRYRNVAGNSSSQGFSGS